MCILEFADGPWIEAIAGETAGLSDLRCWKCGNVDIVHFLFRSISNATARRPARARDGPCRAPRRRSPRRAGLADSVRAQRVLKSARKEAWRQTRRETRVRSMQDVIHINIIYLSYNDVQCFTTVK